ncbi:hypothetical protein Tco_1110946 [Tanacetum coccineum]|uniref:Uncharacterized protein n=1 Tax=Tanacetum coccineum TaxID=301880 RepID=A0ABQ5IK90_9ASTR
MADLKFVDQHNMVACLEKTEENAEFHQIVDFLSTCSINYALTENLDQGKVTPLFNSMLVQNQALEGEGSAIPPELQPTPSTSQPNVLEPQTESLQTKTPPTVSHELQTEAHIEQILPSSSTYQRKQRKTQNLRRAKKAPRNHGGVLAQTRFERVLEKPNEPPLLEGHTSGSEKDSMEHTFELMDTVPPTSHDSPLTGGYIPGSDEGRMTLKDIKAISKSQEIRKERGSQPSHTQKEDIQADSDFDVLDDDMEDVEGKTVHTATTGVSAVSAPVTTAGVAISTAEARTPSTTAATAFIDKDLTSAQTLIKMKEEKAKEKRLLLKYVEDSQ